MDRKTQRTWKYDVFVSFRGDEDMTRNNFTNHLFTALNRGGIKTFTDDDEDDQKERGRKILEAIEHSRISVVIFSRNYAASTVCLEELAKISQCHDLWEQTVFPVFYDVDRFEVRHRIGVCQKAFVEDEERFKDCLVKVERWRNSMIKMTNLSGWDVQSNTDQQHTVIHEIVQSAVRILTPKCISVDDDDGLVGVESRVEEIEKFLDLDSNGVRVIGICGMGGIGKTTLASLVYNRILHLFEARCFLSNVSLLSARNGIVHLQKQLLSTITDRQDLLHIEDASMGIRNIRHVLSCHRILLVLDNVDKLQQLEYLGGEFYRFSPGSKIIITTRDEQILRFLGVNETYKVELLNKDEAYRLFCRCAFKSDHAMRGYEQLTCSALESVQGLPLGIKILASSLHGRSVCEWESVLYKMQEIPHRDIMDVLKPSYDSLGFLERKIFLDIACFFTGEEIDYVIKVLREFDPRHGIDVLNKKSLLTKSNQRIQMHSTLQAMGKEIVRQECVKEPGRRSRLWLYGDFRHVMETNTATKNIEAIVLNLQNPEETDPLNARAFSNMTGLRLLILHNVSFSGSLRYLSNDLQYLSWHKFPFTSLPLNFEPERLYELIMIDSNIAQLWEGKKMLFNLRSLNLSNSRDLIKMPDFRGLPRLETLDLERCVRLLELDSSITFLRNLKFLNLRNCISLVSVPNKLFDLCHLEILNLAGCSKFAQCLNLDPFPLLEHCCQEMGDPVLDCGINREHADSSSQDIDDVARQGENCAAIQVPGIKSKSKAKNFQMGDTSQARAKAKTNARLAKRKRESNSEPASSNSIAKCVDDLGKIDGVSNISYIKALERFQDPYWREVFLSMPCDRKKAWLDSLV